MRFLVFMVSAFVASGQTDDLSWETAIQQAMELRAQGKFAEAQKKAHSAAVHAETFATNDPRLAITLIEMGWLNQRLGQKWDAEKSTSRAIRILERLPDKTVLLANALNQMAVLKLEGGNRAAEAEKLFRRALELSLPILGSHHPELSMIYNNLASALSIQGNHVEARLLYEKLLRLKLNGHPRQENSILSNLGVICYQLGELESARGYLEQALPKIELLEGPDHPELTTPLLNLGRVYIRLGRFQDAEIRLRRAAKIAESSLGLDSPILGGIFSSLADVRRKVGDRKESRLFDRRAKAIESISGDAAFAKARIDISDLAKESGKLRSKSAQ